MKIAILTRAAYRSPRILAEGLSVMLQQLQVDSQIFYGANEMLMRLLPLNEKPAHWHNNLQFRIRNKIKFYKRDRQLLQQLKDFDCIVLSECIPNALWRNFFSIETLRAHLPGKPLLLYEVYFIDNAPIHKRMWLDANDFGADRFDYNLAVSDVTEVRGQPNHRWSSIGMNMESIGLAHGAQTSLTAVVDFEQPGYEVYRKQQIAALKKAGIDTICLEGSYTSTEIRAIYKKAGLFFMAFPETFGLPIAECLACGAYVFTPSSAWPMSWRLDADPMPWAPGHLPPCFKVYASTDDLDKQLQLLKTNWDAQATPKQVAADFLQYYPDFYYGNKKALQRALEQVIK